MKGLMIGISTGLLLVAASGCVTSVPKTNSRTVTFHCSDGRAMSVAFENRTATVIVDGLEPIVLPQVMSGSGFLYMSPQNSLRGKGRQVTWTAGRMVPIECTAV